MGRKVFTLYPQNPNEPDGEFRRNVLLVAQVALLGEVSISVRGVTLGWTSSEIILRAFVEGPVNEDDQEAMHCVGSEIIAAFPNHRIEVKVTRLDPPLALNAHVLNAWVFLRKERFV